ncbi:MAG: Mrp/NBP35 family ATP-binding protein [Clostridia bacterium]|nr:Mrp/NBP35 family ATP-binding protein [Clostridia bacterium]MCR4906673.1 Mrp/NBP35 family ATP-binding protein [Clostridiales bacterium]
MTDSTNCTHDCSTCSANCSSRAPTFEAPHKDSHIKHVIGVVSGKGGVGKSIVSSMLAVTLQRRDLSVALLDADITGPSIPKAFGTKGDILAMDDGLMPLETKTGIKMISVNLLLEDETRPVVWRGPVIAGTVKQFWTDVLWGDVDYMFVDCPPGTGDVPLTVFQSIKLDGVIIVTTPQDLVSMIVSKAVNMASLMNIPVIGLIENMAYVKCPDCGAEIEVFGKSKAEEVAREFGIPVLGRMPIDPKLSALVDRGVIELMENDYLEKAADAVEAFCEKK